MAFLDNSGDIILDAVLTDLGRRRLADGGPNGFVISKFALGDDEIDYALYDKNHPSGSAYYDLEILQTPVFEAFTQINANINYGLLNFSNNNILYMPEWKQNTIDNSALFAQTHQGLYYVAVNQETAKALKDFQFADSLQKLITSNTRNTRIITYELGLDTTELVKNAASRVQNITNNGLVEGRYTLSVNSRFISSVMGYPQRVPPYKNNKSTNALSTFPTPTMLRKQGAGRVSSDRSNYRDYPAMYGSKCEIYVPSSTGTTTSVHSVVRGPSTSIFGFNISVTPGLDSIAGANRDTKYTKFGKIAQSATQTFGSSDASGYTYDFIDTSVYLTGNRTGATISIPIRIIRRAS